MSDIVRDLLNRLGPCLTSKLIEMMVDQGVSPDAARKRVERASGITRLSGVRFEKNAKFIFLDHQYGDARFWGAVEAAFETKGKAYWAAMVGLKRRGGACPKSLFPRICGAPNRRQKQLSPDTILERLIKIHLLKEVQDDKSGETWISFNPHCYNVLAPSLEQRAIAITENLAIAAIADWARKLGFGSYAKFALRNDVQPPVVSGITWDVSAPSYVRPLVSAPEGEIKPGFFVCDVTMGHQISDEEVEVFVRKYDMAASPPKVAPIMGFLVADGFTQAAYDRARSAGIIAATTSQLFGQDVAKALNDLIKVLSDTGKTAAINPEHLENVMNRLTRIEGASANLRGSLFELVVGNLLVAVTGGYLTVGYKISSLAELDVLVDLEEEGRSIIVECKAKVPGAMVSLEEVQRWYDNRVPLINEKIRPYGINYADRKFEFELWTNGTFHPAAIEWLGQQQTEFELHTVGWRDGAYIKQYSQQDTVSPNTRGLLRDYYFNNPKTSIYES
ncbi:hypothetical protein QWI17_19980 [Gilvimarinus sp. SDUM040013]|uniref:Restriction endonuclease n=1 Tax=Gilvimarinus gilvus TaxID=3058038 RepID=A0ABU4RZF7_9GAMM|nr:hypothetical protein [Gilvimarinus sp. SDUM040013]MDO3388135.1 hypothetical protein [Gilvimarinus sp. SDUM040013]MDX6850290.1 hypothetical protein [Gilvimarinus sp. SDUM040013]